MTDAPECTSCGACCFSSLDAYARVMGSDYDRLGDDAERASVFIGHRCFLRMHEGHCAQLVVDAQQRFACAIYEQRPDVCRTLERGSPACAAERERKARQALLSVPRLLRRAS